MVSSRVIEYVFFFGLLGVVSYIVWQIISPFVSALALSAIIGTICYPMYERIRARVPKRNKSVAALLSTLIVLIVIIFPFFFITSALVREAVSVYNLLNSEQATLADRINAFATEMNGIVPLMNIDLAQYAQQAAGVISSSLGSLFAGTASTIFLFFVANMCTFYFFKDCKYFTSKLLALSHSSDLEDGLILRS